MAKIKLTKGELKKQRDSLKQFRHYLPTLQLKKQQLQMKILEARRELAKQKAALEERETIISTWVGLLGDPLVEIDKHVTPIRIVVEEVNIAGANVPVFKEIIFDEQAYDLYLTPFWLDRGIVELREYFRLRIEVAVIEKRIKVLERELRVTTQRVNLFEKVKIPECMDNIRKIQIYLGDQQANAVGISKVAKKKIEQSSGLALVAV